MKDPIQHYFNKYKVDVSLINKIVIGEKYVGIMLKNGDIGVCSTLNLRINAVLDDIIEPDLDNIEHRIILNAYYNALLNYNNSFDKIIDIFDEIDFKKYDNIVMIGFFRSLVKKFEREQINLTIFDKLEKDNILTEMTKQKEFLNKADAVILSGTTIFNKTFYDILNNTRPNCEVFLLGPSNILDIEMFVNKNIRVVFGSVFEKFDDRPLNVIKSGGGTPDFLEYLKKVYIERP